MISTGLIGFPTEHSLSPAIHEYWMQQLGIEGDYKLFTTAPPRLRQVVARLRNKGLRGFNVTVPHKEAVMEYLDGIDDIARQIGAVNTVIARDGKLTGTNTDAYGFIGNLREGHGGSLPDLSKVVLLGAGGAARAAIVALKDAGAGEIVLLNRTAAHAVKLAHEFSVTSGIWDMRGADLQGATLLVNTTSLGMYGQPALDISLQHLTQKTVVYDIVYNPLETTLLKAARNRGNKAIDGLGMLLHQAQKSFALWHGVEPVVDSELRSHVQAAMRQKGAA
jgi:shikimate dehydrogenase